MTDWRNKPESEWTLSDHLAAGQAEADRALPATEGYELHPCPCCGRRRVYLRRDGRRVCEKCETFVTADGREDA